MIILWILSSFIFVNCDEETNLTFPDIICRFSMGRRNWWLTCDNSSFSFFLTKFELRCCLLKVATTTAKVSQNAIFVLGEGSTFMLNFFQKGRTHPLRHATQLCSLIFSHFIIFTTPLILYICKDNWDSRWLGCITYSPVWTWTSLYQIS